MLINIVGCDGSGKTTQIQLLKPWMEESFKRPVRLATKASVFDSDLFPGCKFFGGSYEEIAHKILPQLKRESRSLFLFYLCAMSVSHRPPKPDEIVLLDGYWHKNLATEAALGVDPYWLQLVGSIFPVPDITILLEVEPERIVHRGLDYKPYECGFATDCDAHAFIETQTRVSSFLKSLAESEKWFVVNARQPSTTVCEELKLLLQDRLLRHWKSKEVI
jgi:dTMP kinase